MTELQSVQLPSGIVLRNPLVMAPMTTQLSFYNGYLTKDEIEYYANRAHDIGAVITGAANVHPDGKGWHGELGIYDDKFIPLLHELATGIQAGGAKAIIQIFHAGRMTTSDVLGGTQPVSASAVPAERPGAEVPRALTENEIDALIESFQAAARRAIEAGFDGIELHGANTYILQQFYSPHSNRRDDAWGGDRERRFRFINEVVDGVLQTVRETADHPFIVGYRFSPEEIEEPGLRMEDTFYLVDQLVGKRLDYLHMSTNDYRRRSAEQNYSDKSILSYVAERIAGRLPLIGVGGVETGDQVAELLETAQLAAVGKRLMYEPRWGERILRGEKVDTFAELGLDVASLSRQGLFEFVQNLRSDN